MFPGRPALSMQSITVRDVHKRFLMGEESVEVLRGVDLSLERGEMVCLMGPSGSGKSTLLNLIGTLDRPSEGSIAVEGIELADLSDEEAARYRRDRIGFVFQAFNLVPTLTAAENVALPLIFGGTDSAERSARAAEALARVGLSHRADHRPTELSGGEQQRVAIARAIVGRPSVILADEPTGNLDTVTGDQILELLGEMNRDGQLTFLITTHDAEVASRADRIVHIRDGRIESGPDEEEALP